MNYLFGYGETPAVEEQIKPEAPAYATPDDVDFEAYGKENIQILLDRHTGADKVTTWEVVEDSEDVKIWRGAVEDCDWCPFRAAGASTPTSASSSRCCWTRTARWSWTR